MLDYDDADERERQYSPSSMVDDVAELLDRYHADSAAVRSALAFDRVTYGPGDEQAVDVFWGTSSRVHVFIHGGYWQELSRASASFLAPAFCERGTNYVALGYRLAPQATLEEIVTDVHLGLEATRGAIEAERGECRIVLSGSSAGAHLAAMVAGAHRLTGLILLSGIYDIVPLTRTYVNDSLSLDQARAEQLSPLRLPQPSTVIPTLVSFGEFETDAFKRQSEAFSAHWNLAPPLEIAGRNHFDVVHDLADASTMLGRAAFAMEDHGV